MTFSPEQIAALAPDDASVKAGRGLVNPAKWPTLGQSAEAIWGECQGSGSKPYQVSIDLSGPAFKCTCPSRKFPCKHGLGLMFLAAEKAAAVKNGEPPAWVSDWLNTRREKGEKKAAAAAEKKETPIDPEATAKRVAKRLERMKQGGEEISRWLADQIRSGIATYPQQPPAYFSNVAARMVDAQVPGFANEISRLESVIHTGEHWPHRALAQLGRIHLLAEGLSRFESLPAALQGDLRNYLGWSLDKEEVLLVGERMSDEWAIVGQINIERDKLWERRTFLLGLKTSRAALLLDFAHGNRTFAVPLPVGMKFTAALAFYPAAFPLRALLIENLTDTVPLETPFPAHSTFDTAFEAHADALARNPWLFNAPLSVDGVTPFRRDNLWLLRDKNGVEVSLRMHEMAAWELLSISGGRPIRVFGQLTDGELQVLSAWADGFHNFQTSA